MTRLTCTKFKTSHPVVGANRYKGNPSNTTNNKSPFVVFDRFSLYLLTCTLHEYQHTFFIVSHLLILRMTDKNCRENQNTHFIFNNVSLKIVLFMRYKTILKSQQATCLLHMRFTFWTPTSTYTPSEYVIIIALSLCLHECTSMFTAYVHCLSCFSFLCVCVCVLFFSPPLRMRYWLLCNMF
jgi:hypothetical protein